MVAGGIPGSWVDHPPGTGSLGGPRTVTAGARSLFRNGSRWTMSVGTVYGGLDDPTESVRRVQALGLNAVRITDFLGHNTAEPSAAYDQSAWGRVDQLIEAAREGDLMVVLDLSTYRNLLVSAGIDPYTADWSAFLEFVVDRINTRTGTRYGTDPTIALVAFAGEPAAINGTDNAFPVTSGQLVEFYREVQQYWHERAPGQLLTTGGLLYLDWDSGIDWSAIMNLPHNDVFTIHLYSDADRRTTIPEISAAAARAGRPWLVEEWGANAALGDANRADLFWSSVGAAASYGCAGFGFWNVGPGTGDTFDLGPQFPLTFRAITAWTATTRS